MTTVRFLERDGLLEGVTSEGHSGYAEAGSDIVCAGVSTALGIAAEYLSKIIGGEPDITATDEPEPFVKITVGKQQSACAQQCDTFLRALRSSMEITFGGYGDFVRIITVGQ